MISELSGFPKQAVDRGWYLAEIVANTGVINLLGAMTLVTLNKLSSDVPEEYPFDDPFLLDE